ncbi:MAG: hypothetical protein MI919_29810 [Holophagales bacterium]|nr:hypothetical protein [Holophagales bacterium]
MSQEFDGKTGWEFEIFDNTVVQWQVVSQAANTQEMQILDPNGKVVVDTSVKSVNLSNTSVGFFPVAAGGKYRIKFPAPARSRRRLHP